MYKDPNVVSLGDAIRAILNKYRLEQKFNEAGLINSWEHVVGAMIARHTVQLSVFRRTLFVEVDSASLRNELTYAREKIRTALNKAAGSDIIDEVVFK
jgi:predicted nucleic acid-binding Zn ribbon protein